MLAAVPGFLMCMCVCARGWVHASCVCLKCCGGPLLDYILKLFCMVWKEKCVLSEWRDALLVPVPKKEDLSSCDNWRGISLLDVVGKLFARVLNDCRWWWKKQFQILHVG